MQRGKLTDEIKDKFNINTTELRLIPYFQGLLLNGIPFDPRNIDREERRILQKWRDAGKITFSIGNACTCTKEHWDWMNEIVWIGYVSKTGIDD